MAIHTTRTARMAAAFLLTAGLSLPALAQEGAPAEAQPAEANADLPEGFDILERHVEAIGGAEAGKKLTGVRMSGAMSMPAMGMTGSITVSAAPPAKQLIEISLGNMGSMVQATDGERAWASQPGGAVQMIPEPQASAMIESADFNARYEPRERYASATTTGTENMDGVDVYVVELTTSSGEESIGYYSVETGLQHAEKTRIAPGSDTFGNEVVFLDYKDYDGMKFPTTMKMVQQGFAQELTFETIEINPEFDAGAFDAPGDL
ncbi:MAG: hypothetical protein AAF235_09285 [Planctomycetota bacterium]